MIEMEVIGEVKNDFKEPTELDKIREKESLIIVKEKYEEGLYRIEERDHLQVVFYFHLSAGYKLKAPRHNGEIRGVFASRSPYRPAGIGVTTVKLLKREGRKLKVTMLDALDGTPVLDLKPYAPDLDRAQNTRGKGGENKQ